VAQDILQQAREAYDDAREDMREQHVRMTEDMHFSNPSEPKQWDDAALSVRKGRPCLTFDRTNQFIMQVVNDGRQNKPSIHVLPADDKADIAVAEKLNGIIRHIEYVSRAGAAYDMALECAARVGLGWLRVVPQVMRPETNEQEIRIMRVHDPKSILLQAGWTAQDGSDAMHGFAETLYSKAQFKGMWPKHKEQSWEGDTGSWYTEESVRVAEYFKVDENKVNHIRAYGADGEVSLLEKDFWAQHKLGEVVAKKNGRGETDTFEKKERKVRWIKMSGLEVLDETEFPSQYIPLVPVLGYELWIDGKRFLCGMTRKLMDGQRAYNYLQSALTESLSLQPKAPFMVPIEGLEDLEGDWKQLNSGSPAYLPYNSYDAATGQPIPAPTRLNPPTFPVAFANAAQIASQDMESAIGMFKANLGQQGNETSGRAITAREKQGDTANFHYIDNLSRGIERLGMIVVDMAPRMYDTARQARIMGEDGEQEFVQINPEMPQPVQKEGKKVTAINIGLGAYDVRVKTGPAYASLREEQAEQLSRIMQSAPDLTPILADLWVGAQDWPQAEKTQKRLASLLPPQIQQMEAEEGDDLPPEAMMQIQTLQQQLQEMEQALKHGGAQFAELEHELKTKTGLEQMKLQAAQQAQAAELEQERVLKETEANLKLQIEREGNASAERIAQLDAQLELLKIRAQQEAEDKARQADQAMEGQRMQHEASGKVFEANIQRQAQEADHKAKAAEKKPEKPEPTGPRKSKITIKKQPDGSYVGEKVET
jgi:hypothetical protein